MYSVQVPLRDYIYIEYWRGPDFEILLNKYFPAGWPGGR